MPQNTNPNTNTNTNTNPDADAELTENLRSEKSPPESQTESGTDTDTEAEADGGSEQRLAIGDMVHDVEDDDPDDAVVVNTPPVEVSEWAVSNTDTVASMNPGYPEDSIVIVVIFLSTLTHTDAYSDWDGEDPIGLPAECQTYAFPRGRLRRVGTYPQPQSQPQQQSEAEKENQDRDQGESDTDSDADTPEREKETPRQQQADENESENKESESEIPPVERLTTGQQNLRERLSARSEVDVKPDPDDPTSAVLVVQKLGEEHRIAADGTVSDGPVADRLAEIAHEYLS
jgi:hypothetical protein